MAKELPGGNMISLFITESCYYLSDICNIGRVFPFKGSKTKILMICLFDCILCGILVQNRSHIQEMIALMVLVQFITYIGIFDIKKYQALVLAVLTLPMSTISETLAIRLGGIIFHPLDLSTIYSFQYTVLLALSIVMNFFLGMFLSKIIQYFPKEKGIHNWIILLFPMLTFYFILTLDNYIEIIENNTSIAVMLVGLPLANYIMLYYFGKSSQAIQLDAELRLARQKEIQLSEKYEILNSQYNHNFNFLHNYLHQCIELEDLVKDVQNNTIKDKVHAMGEYAATAFNMIYTSSLALDAIINKYSEQITSHRISLETTIRSNLEALELNEQIMLYESLMDHAIQSSQSAKDSRIINVKMNELRKKKIIYLICSGTETLYKPNEDVQKLFDKHHIDFHTEIDKDNNEQSILLIM